MYSKHCGSPISYTQNLETRHTHVPCLKCRPLQVMYSKHSGSPISYTQNLKTRHTHTLVPCTYCMVFSLLESSYIYTVYANLCMVLANATYRVRSLCINSYRLSRWPRSFYLLSTCFASANIEPDLVLILHCSFVLFSFRNRWPCTLI